MNIGIDIDGVLIDLENAMFDYATKLSVKEGWKIDIDASKYLETKMFKWTEDQADKFWNKYLVEYVTKIEPRRFASEVIKKLRQEGNKIYIITARNEEGLPAEAYGKMQELTKQWLIQNEIEYDKIIFASDTEKKEKCIENDITYMIEDSPSNILDISTKVPVIKYNCEYNREIAGKNIITAYSWYHIYDIIKRN